MLTNIKIWKGALNRRLGFLLNCRKGLSLMRRWALSLRSRSSRERLFFGQVLNNTSFLFHEEKKRNKDELLRTMSEKNSPSALFGLLRQVFPLNKKNSLRSNSFLFLTLQHSPPLHAQKVRPDLSAFFTQHRFARWSGVFSFFCFVCWGECL